MYILGEIGAGPLSLEQDARRLVPEAYGGASDEWLATLRWEFAGSTFLGQYVQNKWKKWKAERAAGGEVANPMVYAFLMADERAAAERARTPAVVRGADGTPLCSCKCGAIAELEYEMQYFARACWEREMEAARESGLPADFAAIERDVREL